MKLIIDISDKRDREKALVFIEAFEAALGNVDNIRALSLTQRTEDALLQEGISTVDQLICLTEVDLLKTRSIGKKSLGEIRLRVEERGLSLGMRSGQ